MKYCFHQSVAILIIFRHPRIVRKGFLGTTIFPVPDAENSSILVVKVLDQSSNNIWMGVQIISSYLHMSMFKNQNNISFD